jgi:predicted transcriptional regulator
MTTVSLKLPEELNAKLEALARGRGVTKSSLMRAAIEELVSDKPSNGKRKRLNAYEAGRHIWGSVDGPGDLSTNPKYMEGYGR